MEITSPPPTRPVTLIHLDVVLSSGQKYTTTLRAEDGDRYTNSAEWLEIVFANGEHVEIAKPHLAMLSTRTRVIQEPIKNWKPGVAGAATPDSAAPSAP